MVTMNRAQLLADLMRDEGFRSVVYDDATGKPLSKGDTIIGQPTIACGWNVAQRPCTQDLAQYILGYFADISWADLCKARPWILNLPEPCQRALANMADNLGVSGLLKFDTFLDLMQHGNYVAAAEDLAGTLWAKQVGARAFRLQVLIRQGAL